MHDINRAAVGLRCWTRIALKTARVGVMRHNGAIACLRAVFACLLIHTTVVAAQNPADFGIFVDPPSPVVGQPYSIRAKTLTVGFPITVDNITQTVNGSFIDLTFFINHGSSINLPTDYEGTVVGPPVPSGTYLIRQYVRQRTLGQGSYSAPALVTSLSMVVTAATNVGDAIEFFHAELNHYFMTVRADEIAALDSGYFSGWTRTGEIYRGVYLNEPSMGSTALPVAPVCRFYGLPEAGLNTHFFSAFSQECALVPQLWPNEWILETPQAFFVSLPDIGDGHCGVGTIPVYRLFNGKSDVNHRYTTSLETRQQMIDLHWIPEGYGPIGVAMCINGP